MSKLSRNAVTACLRLGAVAGEEHAHPVAKASGERPVQGSGDIAGLAEGRHAACPSCEQAVSYETGTTSP
jgi:hypothetical protein